MALSRKERNQIRKVIGGYINQLDSGDLSRKERNQVRKDIGIQLKKLDEAIDASPETAAGNEKLKTLIAGGYNNLSAYEFIDILQEIHNEINDINPLKEPTITYIDKKKSEGAITESAEDAIMSLFEDADSDDDDDDDDDDGKDDEKTKKTDKKRNSGSSDSDDDDSDDDDDDDGDNDSDD